MLTDAPRGEDSQAPSRNSTASARTVAGLGAVEQAEGAKAAMRARAPAGRALGRPRGDLILGTDRGFASAREFREVPWRALLGAAGEEEGGQGEGE